MRWTNKSFVASSLFFHSVVPIIILQSFTGFYDIGSEFYYSNEHFPNTIYANLFTALQMEFFRFSVV
ncbi:hypothetical protein [Evansella cellulosilytica]|uniref:Uncharacterized protein n=1 Tax=Evansella cellulosilytica (strain ATCC 21833 / DSM 2522 / FERM P-1141 / JCM 9156 / N-4) TaxID=649639 RepID=E6TTY6_EVAC2|nr:hypothetical protein [Evansella cellulosilytica]ADU32017.1 hypothetical protein Bcell_3777 [Evansella cellulosilytica DSM 2522]